MHYWNQSNFSGLKAIGDSYLQKAGYEGFARYCLLKEQGLKKPALDALRSFIDQAQEWPIERQREVVEELCQLGSSHPEIHQLLPQPLVTYLQQVLDQWRIDEAESAIPFRWAGFVSGDARCFEEAILRDPNDELSLVRLAQVCLNEVDHQTHHLCESLFIDAEEDAQAAIGSAAKYVLRMPATAARRALQEQVTYYRALLEAWLEYQRGSKSVGFPAWCSQRGLGFSFSSIVYYKK